MEPKAHTLPVGDRKFLKKEAKRLIAFTESFPHTHQAQAERKAELHEMLGAKLRRALEANGVTDVYVHGIYRSVFPNESTVAMYERRTAKRNARERVARGFGSLGWPTGSAPVLWVLLCRD
jgi:hypothetical protein